MSTNPLGSVAALAFGRRRALFQTTRMATITSRSPATEPVAIDASCGMAREGPPCSGLDPAVVLAAVLVVAVVAAFVEVVVTPHSSKSPASEASTMLLRSSARSLHSDRLSLVL